MKTLSVVLLVLIVMGGQLNADNHSAANNKIKLNLDDTSEVSVQGFIAPIGDTVSNSGRNWPALTNMRVVAPEKQYPASVFHAFLPNQLAFLPSKRVSVGELWKVKRDGVLELLRQLHPNPSVNMHINTGDSYGLWACLRAYNDEFADIAFRIHAEFVFEDGWFTPSQFAGRLVPDNTLASVRDIPTNQREVVEYPFDRGQVFKLGAIGNASEKGKINGFLAKISVKPTADK